MELGGDLDLDLSLTNLPPGTRLVLGTAEIEVTAQPHTGCAKFASRFGADALRLKRAALAVMNGELYQEGVPRPMPVTLDGPTEPEVAGTPEEEPAPAG